MFDCSSFSSAKLCFEFFLVTELLAKVFLRLTAVTVPGQLHSVAYLNNF